MVNISPDRIGDPEGDDESTEEGTSDPWPKNLTKEKRELRDAILRIVEEAEAHKHVDQIPDKKDEAIRALANTFLVLVPPYGSENGYDAHRFADIDESLGWFLLERELNVKAVRKPADHLSNSPFSVSIDTEDFGLFDSHDGFGYRITVYYACHDVTGKFIGRREGETKLYPTMFRAAIAAIDVARKIKQDWFSVTA